MSFKKIGFFVLIHCCLLVFSQSKTTRWRDMFSYNQIKVLKTDGDRIIAATSNGLFFYNSVTGEIRKLSKANGLHEVKISAFAFSKTKGSLLIGYESGNMDVVNKEGDITYVIDIPRSTAFNGSKRINHISINGDLAVLSLDYGLSIFNVGTMEFADTSFFVSNNQYRKVYAAVIKNDHVYAATDDGIFEHGFSIDFPIFSTWNRRLTGAFKHLDYATMIVAATDSQVYIGDFATWAPASGNFANLKDIQIFEDYIVVTHQNTLSKISLSGAMVSQKNFEESLETGITHLGKLYAGSSQNGLLNESLISLKPDGPRSNISYKAELVGDQIWVSTGVRSGYWGAGGIQPSQFLGYYHFDGNKWNNIADDDISLQEDGTHYNDLKNFNVLDVTPNPKNKSEIFISSYGPSFQKGIIKMNHNYFKKQYVDPQSFNYVAGGVFDEDNNLFVSHVWGKSSFTTNTISVSVKPAGSDEFQIFILRNGDKKPALQRPYYHDGLVWFMNPRSESASGLYAYDYKKTPANLSDDIAYNLPITELPDPRVFSFAIDKNEDGWIGSASGLRILSNANQTIKDPNAKTRPIVIVQNGIPEELFKDVPILQVKVDAGNQKWVSTEEGGVFFVSADGQKTIHHFNKNNSPLPNNSITDIQINEKTGDVFFVSADGIMVYKGDVREVTKDFSDVKIYPNPVVYAQYKGNVTLTGLAQKTNIRIVDTAGSLVHQAVVRGGFYEWNLANASGNRVSSGIYFVLMTNEDGTDTAKIQIAVVN